MSNDKKFYLSKNLALGIHNVLKKMEEKDQIEYLSDILYFLSMDDLAGLSDDLGVNLEYLIDNDPC